MSEQWRDVVGYEGHYRVSDLGSVWVVRERTARGQRRPVKELKPSVNPGGYPAVSLTRDGRRTGRPVHRLVAAAFLGPCPPGLEIRHLDGNSMNPALANLTYGTHSENNHDQVRHGTHPGTSKEVCVRDHRLIPPNLVIYNLSRGHRACRACAWANSAARHAASRGRPFDLLGFANARYFELMTSDVYLEDWRDAALDAQRSGRWAERDAAWCRALRDVLGLNDRAALALLRKDLGAVELAGGAL